MRYFTASSIGFAAVALFTATLAGAEPIDVTQRPLSPSEDSRPRPVPSFSRDAAPALTKAGCNAGACHGSFQGRGGLQLSLLGFDPLADYDALTKSARGRRVFPAAPEQSLMLLKATAAVPHGGGRRMTVESEAYRVLRDYIAAGLPPPTTDDPHVVRLEVTPGELLLKPGQQAEISVAAYWSDGVRRDATPWALFDSRDQQIVEVSASGVVTANKPGRSPVTVRFLGQVAAVSVTIPYEGLAEPTDFTPRNYIDELVLAQWKRVGVSSAPLAGDYEFVRRVYLDLIGTLPTPDEVRAFVASDDVDKRDQLIDQLLERPEYIDYWSLKWGDLLRVHRRYVGEKGLGSFWGWTRQAVRENRPLDQMVREILTAQGNLFTSGPVAYFFVDEKPEDLAETTSQVFLGVRLQCTRCHHHPQEVWSQDDYYGLAAFFTRLETKENGDQGRFGGARSIRPVDHETKSRRPQVRVSPRLFADGEANIEGVADIRQVLADWITDRENPFFARNFANRYWAYLTGRGLVEPIDDLRATNPPSNPALLDALAADLAGHEFDVKHLLRTICQSRVYQLASEISPDRDKDGMFYTHRVPRRLPAEVLLDAVNQAAGVTEKFPGVPAGTRAIALPDPSIPSYFLTAFGRPLRNNPCECARGGMPDLSQALHLVNSTAVHEKVVDSKGRLARLLMQNQNNSTMSDARIIDELYLAALCRPPTAEEQAAVHELLATAPLRQEGFQDLLWTLLNCSEFVFNH